MQMLLCKVCVGACVVLEAGHLLTSANFILTVARAVCYGCRGAEAMHRRTQEKRMFVDTVISEHTVIMIGTEAFVMVCSCSGNWFCISETAFKIQKYQIFP